MKSLRVMLFIEGLGDRQLEYTSFDDLLNDAGIDMSLAPSRLFAGLASAMSLPGSRCSVWLGSLRLTRDLTSAKQLQQQLVSNSSTILRHLAEK